MTDPQMEQCMQTAIRYVLQHVRKDVMSAAASALQSDPRRAASAVRSSIYKRILGGQVNILRRKRAGSAGSVPDQQPRPGRGGNRIKRSADTERMMGYQGPDRGFVLRFVNHGTVERTSRYGNRGSITGKNFFGPAAQTAIEEAAVLLQKEMDRIIIEKTK